MSVIDLYLDESLRLPGDWNYVRRTGDLDLLAELINGITARQSTRIEEYMNVFMAAVGFKRRLGGDATREELAVDKRICRKMGYVGYSSLGSWTEHRLPPWSAAKNLAGEDLKASQAAAIFDSHVRVRTTMLDSWKCAVFAVSYSARSGEKKLAQKWGSRFASEQRMIANVIERCDVSVDNFIWEIMQKVRGRD